MARMVGCFRISAVPTRMPSRCAVSAASRMAPMEDKPSATRSVVTPNASVPRIPAAISYSVFSVSVSGGTISVESEVEEVEVESIGFDADGNIAIKISGTQKALGGTLYENVTSVPATVTCKVYRKTSLEDAWGDPVATQTVKVGGDSVETIVMEDDGNSSAFFYVEIEK